MLSLSQRFEQACQYIKSQLVIDAPFDTGNLAFNGIKTSQDNGEYHIVIGGENAPYAIYTNEKWEHKEILMGNFKKGQTIKRMRTWDNPNEGWIQKSIQKSKPMVQRIMQGSISKEDFEKELQKQNSLISARLEKHIEILKKQEEKLKRRLET